MASAALVMMFVLRAGVWFAGADGVDGAGLAGVDGVAGVGLVGFAGVVPGVAGVAVNLAVKVISPVIS